MPPSRPHRRPPTRLLLGLVALHGVWLVGVNPEGWAENGDYLIVTAQLHLLRLGSLESSARRAHERGRPLRVTDPARLTLSWHHHRTAPTLYPTAERPTTTGHRAVFPPLEGRGDDLRA